MLVIRGAKGYTQSDGGFIDSIFGDSGGWCGLDDLFEKLRAELDDYSQLQVRISPPNTWNANWRDVARQDYLLREKYYTDPFAIYFIGFSYGVGYGFKQYSKYARRYGLKVESLTSLDGIYRHWNRFGVWRSLVGTSRIRIPSGVVNQVDGFYQRVNHPQGKKLMFHHDTKWGEWNELTLPHGDVPRSGIVHNFVIAKAKYLAEQFCRGTASVPIGTSDYLMESAAVTKRIQNGV
jgi:hypothetical protein